MRTLQLDEIQTIGGGVLSAQEGAACEIAISAIALVCSGGTLALFAVGAAAFCYACD